MSPRRNNDDNGASSAPFTLSDEKPVKLQFRMLLALLGVVAACAIAWTTTRSQVATDSIRIEALENEQRSQREILIRIDERTAEIKRQMDRIGR
jgi:Tfp pilus assembly protein PilN